MSNYTLFLCEKPDQGRAIGRAIGVAKQTNEYIITHNGSIITWGFGHLLTPKAPHDYDENFKKWSWDTLPIIPKSFGFRPKSASAQKQLKVIQGFIKDAKEVIIATDPDREGELIAYLILNHLKWKGLTKRLWLSDLTDSSIKKGIMNLKPAEETKPLYLSALARTCADWLVGMNMSRAGTLRLQENSGKTISIGRVQTPTLALIVRQERKIKEFKPQDYYEISADVQTQSGHLLKMSYAPPQEKRIFDKNKALEIQKQIAGAKNNLNVETKAKTQAPPPLFDLNLLQQEANQKFGWSSAKTLKIAQCLYDSTNGAKQPLLTYPRTDSSALPEVHADHLQPLLHNILSLDKFQHLKNHLKNPEIRKDVYNDKKVTAHHAIVPTLETPRIDMLDNDQKSLYMLVSQRFLMAHMDDFEYLETTISLDANNIILKTAGRQPTHQGWKEATKALGSSTQKEEEEDDEANENEVPEISLPPVKNGELGQVQNSTIVTKTTKSPLRFTEKTLLNAMKNIGAYVEDKNAKALLKKTKGIGTSATRANIIETLKEREYIRIEKRKIVPTDIGFIVIEALEKIKSSYSDASETADWEEYLELIAQSKGTLATFINTTAQKVNNEVKSFKNSTELGNISKLPGIKKLSEEERENALQNGIPLQVPFAKRNKAKSLGAIWNPDKKIWVAPPDSDISKFKKEKFC